MAKKKLTKKNIREIGIFAAIILITFLLWDTIILFPIKLVVVFLHESSHAIAGYLTGGKVIKMDVNFNLGGSCEISGGNSFIIGSSGYLGSFLFGALLFYSAYSKKYRKPIIIFIAIIISLFGINLVTDFNIQIFAVFFSLLLFLSVSYLPVKYNSYILKSLGIISCLYVIYDIKEDLLTTAVNQSDAAAIASITGIPGYIWGILWFTISIVGIFYLFRYGFSKSSGR